MKDNNSIVAKWLTEIRKEKLLNRKQLSKILCISYSRLSRYEKKGNIHYSDLIIILNYFNITINDFISKYLIKELQQKDNLVEIKNILDEMDDENKIFVLNSLIYFRKTKQLYEFLKEL